RVTAAPWVAETAAALSREALERNRLLFDGLGEALLPTQEWPDFPAYLAGLAASMRKGDATMAASLSVMRLCA
ncbi:MAG TPA: hypothetical protein VE082_01775, partial [Desulfobaccales bacterium]|nr:hypothetical protein [Desulfobaccales bacterium]